MSVVAVDRALDVRGRFLVNGTVTDEVLEQILTRYGISIGYKELPEGVCSEVDKEHRLVWLEARLTPAERRWQTAKILGHALMHGVDPRECGQVPELCFSVIDAQATVFAGWFYLADSLGALRHDGPGETALHHNLPAEEIARWSSLILASASWGSYLKGW